MYILFKERIYASYSLGYIMNQRYIFKLWFIKDALEFFEIGFRRHTQLPHRIEFFF